ncbi:hypothetical protein [Herbaspirillum rhizosphaerae]|uniref:hypothetical protein n=1 Tax=Herbaspirillum rhizosphaerae TaxID=346179 RepID=UPI00067C41CA|nr:hypothetical protein [Herbaspirillum rhizosphaerae]
MATSTLDLDVLPISDRQLNKGHDNHALGPSDTSDSGSDMTNIATEADSDSTGTGERASVERGGRDRAPETPESVEQVASDNESGEDIVAADERELEKQTDSVKDAKKTRRDRDLDDALEDTFPASDPINLTPEPPKKVAKGPNSN